MDHKLIICMPVGLQFCRDITACHLAKLMYLLGLSGQFPLDTVDIYRASSSRIHKNRNMAVKHAQEVGATHLLFIDPDMDPDAYANSINDFFFTRAWDAAKKKPGCVWAAPYCGSKGEVQVFGLGQDNEPMRIPDEEAAKLTGWHRMVGVGTGLMLIDMKVFEKLEQPYFFDVYTDETETDLKYSQDISFCMSCAKADVPVFVNFDCWADHVQVVTVGKPTTENDINVRYSASGGWSIEKPLWDAIQVCIRRGIPRPKTLEAGSGISTDLFVRAGCDHTALEHDPKYVPAGRENITQVFPLHGDPPWYEGWEPDGPYDLILIDGPPSRLGGRQGILRVINQLIHDATIIFVDDAGRDDERELIRRLVGEHGFTADVHNGNTKAFAILERKPMG